jgi:hypothetical protein
MAVVTALLVSYVISLLSQGLNAKAADNDATDPLKDRTVSVCALAPSRT